MENYAVILLIMALMIIVSGIADKIKVAVPVLLLISGDHCRFHACHASHRAQSGDHYAAVPASFAV